MATHEWVLEDIIHVEELDDRDYETSNLSSPNNDLSRSTHDDSQAEPSGSQTLSSPESSKFTGYSNSPESIHAYGLSTSLSDEPSTLMLPPSSYNLYQPPWSSLNIGLAIDDGHPRSTPDPLMVGPMTHPGGIVSQPSGINYPFDVYRSRSLGDEMSSPPSYATSESVFPLSPLSERSFTPDDSQSVWRDAFNALPYHHPGAWTQRMGDFNHSMDYCDSRSLFCAPTPPHPGPSISANNVASNFETAIGLLTNPTALLEDVQNTEPCISPNQTINSCNGASPGPRSQAGDAMWPLPDLLLPEQSQLDYQTNHPTPGLPNDDDPPTGGERELSPSPGSGGHDDFHVLVQHARAKWGNVGARDQDSRDAAILEMRSWGLAYKDIKWIGNFPDALPTLRGRHRILTKPSEERVRRPQWQQRDEQLLREAVRVQKAKPRLRRTQRIIWKEVADHVNSHGSSYKFSYVTCSQKWQQMNEPPRGFSHRTVRNVRGRGAFY